MGTDKNAARYQDWDNATVKAPYLPRSTLFGPSLTWPMSGQSAAASHGILAACRPCPLASPALGHS